MPGPIPQAQAGRGARPSGPRIVFAWDQVTVGSFDCWPDDERWRMENHVDEGHVIAFPGTAVEIVQDGREPLVAEPNRVVLYNREQTYRRRLVSRSGDHCTFLVVAPALLEDLARTDELELPDPDRRPFARPELPVARQVHLEARAIMRRLADTVAADDGNDILELQERLVRLVAFVLRHPAPRHRSSGRKVGTEREHRRLAEAARAIIAAEPGQSIGLDQIARQVGASVFHLSRVFREHAGMSLHAYRDELRLRSALPTVLDGSRPLTEVALEHGYASSSHFTDRFRARYGMAPSQLRAVVSRPMRMGTPA